MQLHIFMLSNYINNFNTINKIMKRNIDADNQWSYLLKLQQERMREQQRIEKEEEQIRKQKYKEQLQNLINEKKAKSKNTRDEDIYLLKMVQESNQKKEEEQRNLANKVFHVRYDLARKNLLQKMQKQHMELINKKRQQQMYEYNRKIKQEQFMRKKRQQQQNNLKMKTQLAQAYQNKIQQQQSKKNQYKKNDAIYMQNNLKMLAMTDQQRKQYLNKIRYGYQQNQKTYDLYDGLIKKKQQQKKKVLSKFIQVNPQQNDINTQNNQLDSLDFQMLHSQQKKKIDRSYDSQYLKDPNSQWIKKIQFRRYLQKQIQQKQKKKLNEKKMDLLEVNLNINGFHGNFMMPGLAQDHNKLRHRQIINQSLGLRERLKTVQDASYRD